MLTVLALLAGAAAAYRFDLVDRYLRVGPAQPTEPALVAPPPGLELPEVVEPPLVAPPVSTSAARGGGALDAAAVRRALAPYLDDPDLGPHVLAAVSGLDGGPLVFRRGNGAAIPASTTKLLTAVAALTVLDPEERFVTSTLRRGNTLFLVGGGDPLLAAEPVAVDTYPARADVTTLAERTAERLRADGIRRVRLRYDATLFSGDGVNDAWRADYVPDGIVSRISALWVDEGRPAVGYGRVADPPLAAATAFAGALGRAGIEVAAEPEPKQAPTAAEPVALVEGPSVAEVVDRVLLVSDNEAAEVLAHHVGLASGGSGTFADGSAGTVAALTDLGVDTRGLVLHDGSGLSRRNRITPRTLLDVLAVAATEPLARTALTSLPVAGFTGSLAVRFDEGPPPGRGRVRAKTGTLTNVSSLAGIATGVDGVPMLFVLMADRVAVPDTLDAREAMDSAAGALGACRCGA